MRDYFLSVSDEDAAWALFLFDGTAPEAFGKNDRFKKRWASDSSGFPDWMIAECYDHVGDLAETLALLVQDKTKVCHLIQKKKRGFRILCRLLFYH